MPSHPKASVVVRSMGRIRALCELLTELLAQTYQNFEVVVVEQTTDVTAEEEAALAPFLQHPRVVWVKKPPLGGPGARNEGLKAATGEIVILIDDDDLPVGEDWIANHVAAYADPLLMGFTGRHVRRMGEACPYLKPLRFWIRRCCMQYSWLRLPYTFARFDEDVQRVAWLHGTNASFRRALIWRAGLWDCTVRSQDEHSFAFKLQRVLLEGEYLAFRKAPQVLRRMDIAGGMAKREVNVCDELVNQLRFMHQVVGRYYPMRFVFWYPVYLFIALLRTLTWIWGSARKYGSFRERIRASVQAFWQVPQAIRSARKPIVLPQQ